MSALINAPGFCLSDKDMQLFNKKTGALETKDWPALDYPFSKMEKTLIRSAGSYDRLGEHIIFEKTPISNQGLIGSCVANAWCDAMEILDGLEGQDKVEQLSRLFLYWLSRYLHKATHVDKGTFLRAAAKVLRTIGAVLEKDFPYIKANVHPKEVGLELYTMASNNRLKGFYRITSTGTERLEEIELAIRANHPVVFGTPVSREFCNYRGGDAVLHHPDSWVGRHAMIIVGVRLKSGRYEYLLRNSWGEGWGNTGHVWIDQDYVAWSEFEDIWVGTKNEAIW